MRLLILLTCVFSSFSVFAKSVVSFDLPSGVNVKITESSFDSRHFKITRCQDGESICLINGLPPFGAVTGVPRTYVKSIMVSYQGKVYSLESSNMYNAWGKRPLEYKGVVRYFGGQCFDDKNCEFRGLFSDGAASFVAEWSVVDGVPYRTVLSDSSDIVHLFMKHIDPPDYSQ